MTRVLRNVVTLIAALTPMVGLATPAANATKDFAWHQHNSHAAATWLLADAYDTSVSVYAYGAVVDQFSGAPQRSEGLVDLQVYQGYCDVPGNQWVDRSWYGNVPADVTIPHDFTSATWPTTTVTLSGTETLTPLIGGSCDSLDWENAVTTDLAPSTVTFAGSFKAGGAMVTENYSTRDVSDPYLWVTVSVARARMATDVAVPMTVTDSRLAALESLPSPDFAYIGHTIRIESTVTRGHEHKVVTSR